MLVDGEAIITMQLAKRLSSMEYEREHLIHSDLDWFLTPVKGKRSKRIRRGSVAGRGGFIVWAFHTVQNNAYNRIQ